MRTTVDIESDILMELKKAATKQGVSFREVLNAALRVGLSGRHAAKARKPYICPTFPMGQPASNLDKALALSDAVEDSEVARELELRK